MNVPPRLLWAWMLLFLLACHAHAQGQFLADYETKAGSQTAVLLVASTAPLDQDRFPAPQRHAGSSIAGYIVLGIFAVTVPGAIYLVFILHRAERRSRRKTRRSRRARRDTTYIDDTPAFDGGGASGNLDD
jgi:hypothetical protein